MTGFDVTISMFDLRWPAYILPVLGKRQGRLVFYGHRYSGRWLADKARDFFMKRADRLLTYGGDEVAMMVRRGIDRSKIVIAPNTIYVANHQDFSAYEKASLLYVGRLQERKRLDLALAVFARMQRDIDEKITFDIVGEGEPEQRLRRLAVSLGIADKVRFHGRIIDNELLAPFFRQAIAYVSPGPVGLGVLHSFAFGVPVVTLRTGHHGPEFHNIVDDHNSVIAENEVDLDAKLRRLFLDNGFARQLGHNAYLWYRNERTLDQMVAGFRYAIDQSCVM